MECWKDFWVHVSDISPFFFYFHGIRQVLFYSFERILSYITRTKWTLIAFPDERRKSETSEISWYNNNLRKHTRVRTPVCVRVCVCVFKFWKCPKWTQSFDKEYISFLLRKTLLPLFLSHTPSIFLLNLQFTFPSPPPPSSQYFLVTPPTLSFLSYSFAFSLFSRFYYDPSFCVNPSLLPFIFILFILSPFKYFPPSLSLLLVLPSHTLLFFFLPLYFYPLFFVHSFIPFLTPYISFIIFPLFSYSPFSTPLFPSPFLSISVHSFILTIPT